MRSPVYNQAKQRRLDNMKPTDFVVVIGGANIDIHGKSAAPIRARDSNPGDVHTSAGGVARNVAENLARLGVDCRLISVVGDDHYGQTLMRLSRDAGIDMQHVRVVSSAPTSTYLSVVDDTGDMQVAIADMRIVDCLDAEQLQRHRTMLQQSSLTILDANLPDDAIAWLSSTLAGRTIFADTVSTTKAARIEPYLSSIHTLKTSTIEAEALTGLTARTTAELQEIARKIHDAGVERLFVTQGDQGVFYSAGGEQGTEKYERGDANVCNAGGAGDAFIAGLAYCWLQDFSLHVSLQFALAAADITLSHPATNSPTMSVASVNRAIEAAHDE